MTKSNAVGLGLFEVPYPSVTAATCPFPLYAALRSESPAYEIPDHPGDFLVSRHADVVQVLRDTRTFTVDVRKVPRECWWDAQPFRGYGVGDEPNLLAVDPPEHSERRKLSSRPFTPQRLSSYEDAVRATADELIDGFDEADVELVKQFALPLPVIAFSAIFGLPRDDVPILTGLSTLATENEQSFRYLPPGQKEAIRGRHALELEAGGQADKEYWARRIREKYENPEDDGLSIMIRQQIERDGELDVRLLTAEASLLLSGGVITTAHLIASAMMLLLQHPRELARLRADRTLIRRMIEEVLRLESPVQFRGRLVTADTKIGEVPIRAGSRVLCVLGSANRDEGVWSAPDDFSIDRENFNLHVAFGSGPHTCLGAPLARLETRIAFEQLLTRFAEIRLGAKHQAFRPLQSTVFRAPAEVWLELTRA